MAKTSKNAMRFADYDDETINAQRKEIEERETGDLFKPKEGTNRVRFMPVPEDFGHPPIVKVWSHGIEIEDGRSAKPQFRSFNCPKLMTKGKSRCPECEYEVQMEATNAMDESAIYKRKPRRQVYANVTVRDLSGEGADRVQVYRYTKTVDDLLEAMHKDDGPFVNMTTGYDVTINRPPKTQGEKDSVKPANKGKATPLDPAGDWVGQLVNLKKYTKILSYEEIQAKMSGEDRPQRGGTRAPGGELPPHRRTAADDAEDDDDDDDEEDEDDDEEDEE